jgi:replicative DNA helicase
MYLPERDLLVLLLKKDNYHQFYQHIDLPHLKDNYKELYYLYLSLREVHDLIPNDLDIPGLQAFFFQKYPDVDKQIYLELFKTLSETLIDPTLGLVLLNRIKARKQALKLSEAAFKFSNGNGTYEQVTEASNDFSGGEDSNATEFEFVTTSLSSIIHEIFQKPGLRWRLDALNKSLGSLRKGNFGFLFARPEVGKTTFLASEISYMLTQLKDDHGPIIWFNNEQVGAEVMLRVYQGYFGLRLEQIKSNPEKYEKEFEEQTKGRFRLVDNANVEKGLVERLLKQYNPSLVIFDQIDKIKGFAADREDLRLGAIYIWARELAKTYCPTIGICQADGSAENLKWLTMENVANAKTSKQAEADWILGMGAVHSEGMQFIRYLNISKNKLMGDDDTLPKLRHGRFEVLIEPEIARFKDIMNYE